MTHSDLIKTRPQRSPRTPASRSARRTASRPKPRFPNTIEQHRRAQQMSIAELAARMGTSRSHLSRVEAGDCIPSSLLLHDLARCLGVLVDTLYDREWSWSRKKRLCAIQQHT